MKQNFNHSADFLKGILILLVIVGHVIPNSVPRYLIYYIHMPIFLALLGFYLNRNKLGITYLFTRLRRLLIPYAIFSVAYFAYVNHGVENLSAMLQSIFIIPYFHLWFLYSAAIHVIIIYMLNRTLSLKWISYSMVPYIFFSVVVDHYVQYSTPIEFKRSFAWAIFSILGFLMANYLIPRYGKSIGGRLIAFGAILYAVLSGIRVFIDAHTPGFPVLGELNERMTWLSSGLFFFNNLLFIAILLLLIERHSSLNITPVNFIGRNSLTIYLVHAFIILFLHERGVQNSTVIIAITIALSVGVAVVVRLVRRRRPVDHHEKSRP